MVLYYNRRGHWSSLNSIYLQDIIVKDGIYLIILYVTLGRVKSIKSYWSLCTNPFMTSQQLNSFLITMVSILVGKYLTIGDKIGKENWQTLFDQKKVIYSSGIVIRMSILLSLFLDTETLNPTVIVPSIHCSLSVVGFIELNWGLMNIVNSLHSLL